MSISQIVSPSNFMTVCMAKFINMYKTIACLFLPLFKLC